MPFADFCREPDGLKIQKALQTGAPFYLVVSSFAGTVPAKRPSFQVRDHAGFLPSGKFQN